MKILFSFLINLLVIFKSFSQQNYIDTDLTNLYKSSLNDLSLILANNGSFKKANTRVYEIQRRGLDVKVPVENYKPDDSMFPDLKEPPKK